MRAFEVHHCSIFGQNASNYAIWYFHHQQPWQILIKICANVNILGKTSQKKTPFFCPLPPPPTHTRKFGQLFHLKMKIRAGGCSSNLGIAQATGCFFWEVFPQSIWVSAQKSAKFWAQIRRIVGANHRGRGASDWCEIYSDANWRQNRCHQKIATTTANSNNIAPGRSLDSAECSLLRLRAICWIFFGLVSFALLHFEFATVVLLAPSTVRAILQLALVFKGFELDFLFCSSVNTQTEC